jgi:hypothetical protein
MDLTPVATAISALVGMAVATAVVFAFGSLLITALAPRLEADPIAWAVAVLLCGLVLSGFVVMIPARLAPTGVFGLIVAGVIPIILIGTALATIGPRVPTLRRGLPTRRFHFAAMRPLRDWSGAVALLALVALVLLHGPSTSGSIELAGTQEGTEVHVEVLFDRPDALQYLLVASGRQLKEPISIQLFPRGSELLTFDFPQGSGLSIELRAADGEVLRRLSVR